MATSRITFSEWLPDQPGLSGAITDIKNVVPKAIGYGPFPEEVDYSDSASEDLNSVFSSSDTSGNTYVFAGSQNKLFKLDSTDLSLDDVSGASYSDVTRWRFTKFGNLVLAASPSNKIQSFEMGSSTTFDDVDASAPTARFLCVVRDFVVTANQPSNKIRVQWSGINDATSWTSSQVTQADYQDIQDVGEIRGVTGGEFGLVLCENAIYRMTYIGTPLIFQFDNIANNIGCFEANSVVQWRGITYFLGDDGFYACNGQIVEAIGAEKVNRYFFSTMSKSEQATMSATVDPERGLVIWGYRSTDGTYRLLCYHITTKRWSVIDTDINRVGSSETPAFSLEALDSISASIDAMTVSLDSRAYAGGQFFLSGVKGAKIISFNGDPKSGYISTADIGNTPQSTMLTMIKPIIDGGSANAATSSRFNLDEDIEFLSEVAASSEGRIGVRTVGKYHRIKVVPTGSWTTAAGIDIEIQQSGGR